MTDGKKRGRPRDDTFHDLWRLMNKYAGRTVSERAVRYQYAWNNAMAANPELREFVEYNMGERYRYLNQTAMRFITKLPMRDQVPVADQIVRRGTGHVHEVIREYERTHGAPLGDNALQIARTTVSEARRYGFDAEYLYDTDELTNGEHVLLGITIWIKPKEK